MTKVRFAPSPTGFLHIGGARTCLFNWLYARNTGGEFILRIEDTDVERSKEEYLNEILQSIKWLGMSWDDINYQSKRFDIYHQHAQKLIDNGRAYRKDGAVFFRYEFHQTGIDDMVRGKIVFNELPKEEEVIIKSDNSPTYNFCCVVDDSLMEITHVIRGEDHISNTPKQVMMYEALGFTAPRFAHVPMILSPQGGRMSKRYGATSIREYMQAGYLSDAIGNYLLLLGWSPGEKKEIISLDEAKDLFDIKDVNKSGAVFSLDKLNWVNGEYIRRKSLEELTDLSQPYLDKIMQESVRRASYDRAYEEKVVALFKERLVVLGDLAERSRFCFYDDFEYAADAKDKLDKDLSPAVTALIGKFSGIDDFRTQVLEREFRLVAESMSLKVKDMVHPVRVALTGSKVGPGLFETMEVLGKDRVISRLNRLLRYWTDIKTQTHAG